MQVVGARLSSFVMSAIASGWKVILRNQTLEDDNYDLRKVAIYPSPVPCAAFAAAPELLEQGAAVSGRRQVLPRAAILE